MLVLSRRNLQSLYLNMKMDNVKAAIEALEQGDSDKALGLLKKIGGKQIKVQVVGIGKSVRLGIQADSDVTILRDELVDKKTAPKTETAPQTVATLGN